MAYPIERSETSVKAARVDSERTGLPPPSCWKVQRCPGRTRIVITTFFTQGIVDHPTEGILDTYRHFRIRTTRFFMSMQGSPLYIWLIVIQVSPVKSSQ